MTTPKKSVSTVANAPRQTKNTTHFSEIDASGAASKVVLNGGVYVSADALAQIGNPEQVRVTVEAA